MKDRFRCRGKRDDNGKWVYWDVFGNYTESILNDKKDMKGNINGIEILSETLGEYTWFTDKNNTPIYEGDVYRYIDYTAEGNPIRTMCINNYIIMI